LRDKEKVAAKSLPPVLTIASSSERKGGWRKNLEGGKFQKRRREVKIELSLTFDRRRRRGKRGGKRG